MRVAYQDGPTGPRTPPSDVVAAAGLDGPVEVFLGWVLGRHDWIDDPGLVGTATMVAPGVAAAVRAGRIRPLPVRLGAVPTMLREQPPDVGVVTGVRRGDGFAFARSVGWGDTLAAVAGRLVVEVDETAPDLGGPAIEGNVVATVPRPPGTGAPPPPRDLDDVDRAIGDLVVSLFPPDATVQFGLGGVADAVAAAIDRPVGLWSGLLTDQAARIAERGLLTGPVTASYTWGGAPIDRLHADGNLHLTSVSTTHDIGRLASIDRLVTVNGALQVGLDGSVNVESVGGRQLSGIGGHSDFCAGATRSRGGISIVATRSTTSTGEPCIVPAVEVVSTPRSDVGVVVTEHGIADLRGCDPAERARRLRSIG